jgi:hypothetical protein
MLAEQHRTLGDVAGDPARLILGEHSGNVRIAGCFRE